MSLEPQGQVSCDVSVSTQPLEELSLNMKAKRSQRGGGERAQLLGALAALAEDS